MQPWSVLFAVAIAAYAIGFLVGKGRAQQKHDVPPRGDLPLPNDEVVRLVGAGKVIDAIRTYREQTGASLKDSKGVIDQLRARPK